MSVQRLRNTVGQITLEEFRWQESHYDHDSRRGRELLFLMANSEWIRASSEIIEVNRSDAVETLIKIDVDLDQITHEAFRKRTGRFWLPVIVLPPPHVSVDEKARDEGSELGRHPEPDLFATVTNAEGSMLAIMPGTDVRHQISAAMAEIVVNMAIARWPGPYELRPIPTRDQRLLLAAAIFRLLRHEQPRPLAADPDIEGQLFLQASRIGNAKEELIRLLSTYINLVDEQSRIIPGLSTSQQPPEPGGEDPVAAELANRALLVLEALAQSVVVVVPVDRESTPAVLTVRVPTREMTERSGWLLAKPSTWILRPLGHLQIDLLLPSADADRQVQVNLPEGLFFEEEGSARASLDIEVALPRALKHLAVLITQLLDTQSRALQQCIADLAKAKADIARETLRQHHIGSVVASETQAGISGQTATDNAGAQLDQLCTGLDQLSMGREVDAARLAELRQVWIVFDQLTRSLFRRTWAERSSYRTIVARADVIEEISQRATPMNARVHVHIGVTEAEYYSVARFSGVMSILLMAVVLAFFPIASLLGYNSAPSPEVLTIVLTLFSAIQAGRIERPDRSTLRGSLSAIGNWLIVASVLPTIVLAVVLAFSPSRAWAIVWAAICIGLQVLLQLAMWHGPLSSSGSLSRGRAREFQTIGLDYRHADVLQSDWWRSTTADALMLGRKARAYAVWQEGNGTSLTRLLKCAVQAGPAPQDDSLTTVPAPPAANVLALLRAGTAKQIVTFVVFREEPVRDWAAPAHVHELDLDPDRLAPLEHITSTLDVFVGVPLDCGLLTLLRHPLNNVLGTASRHGLLVLEIQLPVPAPVAVEVGCAWARVRIAVRDVDIGHIAPFLSAIDRLTSEADGKRRPLSLAVRAGPTGGPRIISRSAASAGASRLILASDLDVIALAANDRVSVKDACWQVLTICADARSGIENDILGRLGEQRPGLHVAGLTYALLHGTAVAMLLGHEPGRRTGGDSDLQYDLSSGRALTKLQVVVNEWRSREQLGYVDRRPLLRVHFRAQDRPGTLLDVLDALSLALQEELPSFSARKLHTWYAHTQVIGGADLASLTVRLDTEAEKVESWNSSTFHEILRSA